MHFRAHFCGVVCDLRPVIVVCVSGALVINLRLRAHTYASIHSLTTPTLHTERNALNLNTMPKRPLYCSRSPRLGQDLRVLGQDFTYSNSSLLNRSANIAYSSPNYTSTSPGASYRSSSPKSPSLSLGGRVYSSPLTSRDGRVLGQ